MTVFFRVTTVTVAISYCYGVSHLQQQKSFSAPVSRAEYMFRIQQLLLLLLLPMLITLLGRKSGSQDVS